MAQVQAKRSLKRKVVHSETIQPLKQDMIIQEKQSFAIVHTLLWASVAGLAFLRQLFPKDCFEDRDCSLICEDAERAYLEAKGSLERRNLPNTNPKPVIAGKPLMMLKKGKHNGVNKLIDWLNVICNGVLKHSIAGVRFSIYADQDNPSNVIEAYTFSFHYLAAADGTMKRLAGMALGLSDSPVTTASARSGLRHIIDKMNLYHTFIPDLPRKWRHEELFRTFSDQISEACRYLICHLVHTSDHQQDQTPSGFQPCDNPEMFVPEDEWWHMKTKELGTLNSGLHRVELKVDYMAMDEHVETDLDEAPDIPQRMHHHKPAQWLKPFEDAPTPQEPLATLSPLSNSSAGDDLSLDSSTDSSSPGGDPCEEPTAPGRLNDCIAANNMDIGEAHDHSLDATQILPTGVLEPGAVVKRQLFPAKALEIRRKRNAQQVSVLAGNISVVQCECASGKALGDMRCTCCGTWQHRPCYGFTLEPPGEEHVCYRCLLGDSDPPRLEDMKRLAQFRRALWFAYDQECPGSQTQFGEALGLDQRTSATLVERLREEGFLVYFEWKLRPVRTKSQIAIRHSCYCNPLTLIGQFYELHEEAITQVLQTPEEGPPSKRLRNRTG